MEQVKVFRRGEKVRVEYEIDAKFMKNDEIYYTLKNPANATILKGVAFTADELIPIGEQEVTQEGEE